MADCPSPDAHRCAVPRRPQDAAHQDDEEEEGDHEDDHDDARQLRMRIVRMGVRVFGLDF